MRSLRVKSSVLSLASGYILTDSQIALNRIWQTPRGVGEENSSKMPSARVR